MGRRDPIEYVLLGGEMVDAIDAGMSQREVARELGCSQAWVSYVTGFYLGVMGETRWWARRACNTAPQAISARHTEVAA